MTSIERLRLWSGCGVRESSVIYVESLTKASSSARVCPQLGTEDAEIEGSPSEKNPELPNVLFQPGKVRRKNK